MLKNRVIPCLLLNDSKLVKTTSFKNPKYVGDPINAIKIFNAKEVDEIMVIDISATKKGKDPNYKLIEEFASECFMPLCYGGGVKTFNQAKQIFSLGVEKICINSSLIDNINLIKEITDHFGSQSIVASVDVKKNWLNQYKLYSHKINSTLDSDWIELIKKSIESGAGEVLLNAVHCDGLMKGPDLNIIRKISEYISVPLIYIGGISSLNDIKEAVKSGSSAVGAGAFFVYHGPHRAVLITYPQYNKLENLFKNE
jgi:cyclase